MPAVVPSPGMPSWASVELSLSAFPDEADDLLVEDVEPSKLTDLA